MRRIAYQWLAISSVLILIAGFAHGRTRPRYGGVVRAETSGPLWSLDGMAHALTTETLTQVDRLGEVKPGLALSWFSQNGDRRWIFTIRRGVKFHDGSALTPTGVAAALSECSACPWRSVQAVGDTVVFEFESPSPLFPAQLGSPQFGISRTSPEGNPIGTGPMSVQSSSPHGATLTAFEHYWGGRPFVDSVEITADRSARDQLLDLSVGRADLIEVSPELIRRAQQDHVRVLSSRNDQLIVLVLNSASPSMQNPDVRKALRESLDRTPLLNVFFQKQGEITGSLLPNWLTGYGTLFSTSQNLRDARELRSRSAQVPPLTLTYKAKDPSLQLIAERIALNVHDAGFSVRAIPAPAHWDLTLMRIHLDSFHPSVALEDTLAAIGVDHKAPDDRSADSLYRREREVLDRDWIVPLIYLPHLYAAGERIHDWKLDESGVPDFLNMWTEAPK